MDPEGASLRAEHPLQLELRLRESLRHHLPAAGSVARIVCAGVAMGAAGVQPSHLDLPDERETARDGGRAPLEGDRRRREAARARWLEEARCAGAEQRTRAGKKQGPKEGNWDWGWAEWTDILSQLVDFSGVGRKK